MIKKMLCWLLSFGFTYAAFAFVFMDFGWMENKGSGIRALSILIYIIVYCVMVIIDDADNNTK
jgi:hypothetical protein